MPARRPDAHRNPSRIRWHLFRPGRDLENLPPFPADWDTVYLGGLCTRTYEGPPHGSTWVRGDVYCNRACVIGADLYDEVLAEGWDYTARPFDDFMVHRVHPRRRAHVPVDPFIVQVPDWSDVSRRSKWQGYKWPQVGERFFPPWHLVRGHAR